MFQPREDTDWAGYKTSSPGGIGIPNNLLP
jgi:hypothetical protein